MATAKKENQPKEIDYNDDDAVRVINKTPTRFQAINPETEEVHMLEGNGEGTFPKWAVETWKKVKYFGQESIVDFSEKEVKARDIALEKAAEELSATREKLSAKEEESSQLISRLAALEAELKQARSVKPDEPKPVEAKPSATTNKGK